MKLLKLWKSLTALYKTTSIWFHFQLFSFLFIAVSGFSENSENCLHLTYNLCMSVRAWACTQPIGRGGREEEEEMEEIHKKVNAF